MKERKMLQGRQRQRKKYKALTTWIDSHYKDWIGDRDRDMTYVGPQKREYYGESLCACVCERRKEDRDRVG